MLYPESADACKDLLAREFPFQVPEDEGRLGGRYAEIEVWCVDRFESQDAYRLYDMSVKGRTIDPDARWCYGYGKYRFKTHRDAIEFKMRWG